MWSILQHPPWPVTVINKIGVICEIIEIIHGVSTLNMATNSVNIRKEEIVLPAMFIFL